MTISDVVRLIAPKTDVRIRLLTKGEGKFFVGTTGTYKTHELLKRLMAENCDTALVTCIYPLFHAQELYIECMLVLD